MDAIYLRGDEDEIDGTLSKEELDWCGGDFRDRRSISLLAATPNQNQSLFDLFPSPRGGGHPSIEGKEKGIGRDGDWKMVWVTGEKKEIEEDGDWKMVWVSDGKKEIGEDDDWKKMMKKFGFG
ncbi:hypothetical protein LWI28_017755 [Acer negundo]|uniref:Uncharacterized protein n=1 Tax=Acer negundo TaxID=4023 RepID=A0AAD5IUN1_ACENE|nr:hypothetical protein LWI28_017755 [Acer negundo]